MLNGVFPLKSRRASVLELARPLSASTSNNVIAGLALTVEIRGASLEVCLHPHRRLEHP